MIAIVGLGSNIDRRINVPRAIRELNRNATIVRLSSIWESLPTHDPTNPLFYNAALTLETELSETELKTTVLRPVESRLGRVRSADRNAPRPIDLDILIMGDQAVEPDLPRFRHLLIPAAEVAPRWVHPLEGRSLEELADSSYPRWRKRPTEGGFHWVRSLDHLLVG